MIKKICALICISICVVILLSRGAQSSGANDNEVVTKVTIKELNENPVAWLNKRICVEGVVVCILHSWKSTWPPPAQSVYFLQERDSQDKENNTLILYSPKNLSLQEFVGKNVIVEGIWQNMTVEFPKTTCEWYYVEVDDIDLISDKRTERYLDYAPWVTLGVAVIIVAIILMYVWYRCYKMK